MRSLLAAILLLAAVAPAAAADWQRLGDGTAGSDEDRWLTLSAEGSFRGYDTQLDRFGPPVEHPCPLSALGRGRALLRCSPSPTQSHVARSFHLVDLATGAVRRLRRTGNRKGLSADSLSDLGRHWAGGLSCGKDHEGTCPQVYVNLRTGKRLRVADRKRRDLDSRRLRVIRGPLPVELVQTGPPAFELLLRRPARPDVLLRPCQGSMECWHAYLRSGVAFWHGDDGALNAYDARTDRHRLLALPDGSNRPVATATQYALVLTSASGVYITAR